MHSIPFKIPFKSLPIRQIECPATRFIIIDEIPLISYPIFVEFIEIGVVEALVE